MISLLGVSAGIQDICSYPSSSSYDCGRLSQCKQHTYWDAGPFCESVCCFCDAMPEFLIWKSLYKQLHIQSWTKCWNLIHKHRCNHSSWNILLVKTGIIRKDHTIGPKHYVCRDYLVGKGKYSSVLVSLCFYCFLQLGSLSPSKVKTMLNVYDQAS